MEKSLSSESRSEVGSSKGTSEGNVDSKVGESSGVSDKVARVEIAPVTLSMGVDTVEVEVEASAAQYSTQFEGYSGVSDKVVSGTREVMD